LKVPQNLIINIGSHFVIVRACKKKFSDSSSANIFYRVKMDPCAKFCAIIHSVTII